MGEDLHVDPRFVHFLDAHLTEVVEAFEHVGIAHALAADKLRGQFLVPVVLLQRDDRTFQPWQHDVPSPARCWMTLPSNGEGACHGGAGA